MRVQLALNVTDLEEAVDFYSRLFATAPARRRPGYANFAIADPPLKLVLFEQPDAAPGSLNHLGVEAETADEVVGAEARIAGLGLETTPIADTACCYATKTETWVHGPEGHRWEWYVRTGDSEHSAPVLLAGPADAGACGAGDGASCCP